MNTLDYAIAEYNAHTDACPIGQGLSIELHTAQCQKGAELLRGIGQACPAGADVLPIAR